MRWVFLLVGLAAGFAVGWSTSSAPRSERRSAGAERADRGGIETPPPADARDEPEGGGDLEHAEAGIVAPALDAQASDLGGEARIEVEFEEPRFNRTVWLAYTDLRGRREEVDFMAVPPSRVATHVGAPGLCNVWWLDGVQRVGTRVRLVADRTVRIRASEYRTAYIEPGLGVLAIRVSTTWGKPLVGVPVRFSGVAGGDSERTDFRGRLSATVKPGEYTVEVGDHETTVVVAAGEQALLEIQPRGEGDLLFEPCPWIVTGRVSLRSVDHKKTRAFSLVGGMNGPRMGFAFVRAGEYEIIRSFSPGASGGAVLGRARVIAGRTNLVPLDLPTGRLEVIVEATKPPPAQILIMRLAGGGEKAEFGYAGLTRSTESMGRFVARVDGVPAGRYRVTCGDPSTAKVVEVGADAATLTLTLP